METVTLVTNDDVRFEVSLEVANKFVTVKNLLVDSVDSVIPLSEVSSKTLPKIVEYAKYHLENPFTDNKDERYMTEWDVNFCNVDKDFLIHLIASANYLEYKDLVETTTQAMADLISGKTPEEIRELFNIEDDMNDEEKEEFKKENKWLEE